jgi:hypothetical protein
MATTKTIGAQIIRLLSSGSKPKDSKLRERYIYAEILQVVHKLIRGEYFEFKNDGESSVNHLYIGTYPNITVSIDSQRTKNYALLPASPMNLPGGLGIYQIKPYTGDIDKDVAMIPCQQNDLELFRSLNTGLEIMKDQWMFFPERDRVTFSENNNETLLEAGITKVEMQLVIIDPVQITPTDPLPIPPSMEIDVIQGVLALHGYTSKEAADMVNDGNPNTK